MQYDKYADQLLAQQATIPTNTIFEILLGFSWHELEKAEKAAERLTPEYGYQQKNKVSEAKKASGHNIPRFNYQRLSDHPKNVFTADKLKAGLAYKKLCVWMGIKFHNDPSGLNLGQQYQTSGFFRWIDSDGILARLEEQVDGFKAPDRAHEFIGYVIAGLEPEPKPAPAPDIPPKGTAKIESPSINKIKSFFPAPPGTKWKDIGFKINANIHVEIKINDKKEIFMPNEFEKIIPQNKIRTLLSQVIHSKGVFDKSLFSEEDRGNERQLVSKLRGTLKDLFGINVDPIPCQDSQYKTAFSATSEIKNPHSADE